MKLNLKVQNIGRREFEQARYKLDPKDTFLISINDPTQEPPKIDYNKFYNFDYYFFLDTEDKSDEFSLSNLDRIYIVSDIFYAIENNLNVLVHCNAGISRSGAVAELCEALGFEYIGNHKQPNLLVKQKLFAEAIKQGLLK